MDFPPDLPDTLKLLLDLRDLDEMGDVALLELAADARIETLARGKRLSIDDHLDRHLYLIEGEVELRAAERVMQQVQAGTDRARTPLFRVRTHGLAAHALSDARLLSLSQATYERHARAIPQHANKGFSVHEVEQDDLDADLLHEVRQAFYHHEVDLPTLPELATRINHAVQRQDVDLKRIAAGVASDPVIAARVVQVANSAMYAGVNRIESVQQAITRIGLLATRAIVMTVMMKNLYKPSAPDIKRRMHTYYQHSLRVAALCHVIAGRLKGFDPERAFLAGLIHDIGTLPLLILADRHEILGTDAIQLDAIVAQLKGAVGETLLKQWGFEPELANVALSAEDWTRNVDSADYCDIVQVAQLHCQLVGGRKPGQTPIISELPAFARLHMDQVDPVRLVMDAQQEIREIVQLLAA